MGLDRDSTIRTVEIDTKIPNCFIAQVILPIKYNGDVASYVDAKKYEEDCKSLRRVSVKMLYSDSVFHNVTICDQVLGKITYPTQEKPRTTFVICLRKFPDNLPIIVSTYNNDASSDASYTEYKYEASSVTTSFDPTNSTIMLQARSETENTLISLESVSDKAKIKLYSKGNVEVNGNELVSIQAPIISVAAVKAGTDEIVSILGVDKDSVTMASGSMMFNVTDTGIYANKIDNLLAAGDNNNDDGTDYVVLAKNLISILNEIVDVLMGANTNVSGVPVPLTTGIDMNPVAKSMALLKPKIDTIKSKIFKSS